MTIGNHFWSDYLRHVFKAFWRALERTDTLVVGLLILGGVGSLWFGGHAEHPSWQRITKLSVEYQNTETAIPLPGDGRYCLHARETTVFAVDVPDLEITLTALGNPTTVRISFCSNMIMLFFYESERCNALLTAILETLRGTITTLI
jgi:hypothetical protein